MTRRFAAFILTHGRPDTVITFDKLRAAGYTGEIVFVVDNEDETMPRYIERFGRERVVIFDKLAMANRIDEGNNFDNRQVIVHARNACFDIAADRGLTHFVELDDDYYFFGFRDSNGAKPIRRIGPVFEAVLDFLDATPALSVAFSQGGDHIGGFDGVRMKRKAMNSFFCRTDRPFTFVGSINEDVNTYVGLGSRGDLFLTFTGLQLDQKDTQSQDGGMTDVYLQYGTYLKSFATVLYHPSSVSVRMMGTTHRRLHHAIDWGATVPRIVPFSCRKPRPGCSQCGGTRLAPTRNGVRRGTCHCAAP